MAVREVLIAMAEFACSDTQGKSRGEMYLYLHGISQQTDMQPLLGHRLPSLLQAHVWPRKQCFTKRGRSKARANGIGHGWGSPGCAGAHKAEVGEETQLLGHSVSVFSRYDAQSACATARNSLFETKNGTCWETEMLTGRGCHQRVDGDLQGHSHLFGVRHQLDMARKQTLPAS